ncbi:uncharacterized protein V1518DRAFT_398553 [Limtongia smithiae]|uniref:uncharacterized protein n=1 Tax=Limtongia smithiae TaxID=1125753 RepID=UPI0034CF2125
MSLRVYNAHTGRAVDLNAGRFLNLSELKDAIAAVHAVVSSQQILMTSRATQLRIANIANETELYLFDRLLLAQPTPTPPPSLSPLIPLNPQPVPNMENPKPSQDELVEMFEARAAWASALLTRAESLSSSLATTMAEIQVIRRSVHVAIAHLSQHLANIEKSFKDVIAVAVEIAHEYGMTGWDASLARLDEIEVIDAFGGGRLSAWVDAEKIKAIQNDFDDQHIRDRVRDIKFVSDKVTSESEALSHEIAASDEAKLAGAFEGAPGILEDLQAVVAKIGKDAEYIADLPKTPASMRSIARMATLHQREYLPNISAAVGELWEYNRLAQSRKSTAQISSLRQLHTLSLVQSRASPIRPDIASLERELEMSQACITMLRQMDALPITYGSLLIELVRRAEWNERLRAVSSEVAEDFAGWREDETKRRTKWLKRFGASLDLLQQGSVTGSLAGGSVYGLRNTSASMYAVELNLVQSRDTESLPTVSRAELYAYVDALRKVCGAEAAAAEVQEMLSRLDPSGSSTSSQERPRRSGARERMFTKTTLADSRGSAFDHEETPSERMRALEQDNRNLVEKVKAYESRVRRLEDLLYQQRVSRSPSPGAAPPGALPVMTPLHVQPPGVSRHHSAPEAAEHHTRRQQQQQQQQHSYGGSSMGSSGMKSPTMRAESTGTSPVTTSALSHSAQDLRQEVQQLRTTLGWEKERVSRVRLQLDETEHVKQDLLANLTQQEMEFQVERRALNAEISGLKARIYAMEEEEEAAEAERAEREAVIAELEAALAGGSGRGEVWGRQ